jgi:cytochrome c oxidase subunit IV
VTIDGKQSDACSSVPHNTLLPFDYAQIQIDTNIPVDLSLQVVSALILCTRISYYSRLTVILHYYVWSLLSIHRILSVGHRIGPYFMHLWHFSGL